MLGKNTQFRVVDNRVLAALENSCIVEHLGGQSEALSNKSRGGALGGGVKAGGRDIVVGSRRVRHRKMCLFLKGYGLRMLLIDCGQLPVTGLALFLGWSHTH